MLNHIGTQRIETDRLILRPFALRDGPAMFERWAGDAEATRWLNWGPHTNRWETEAVIALWLDSYQTGRQYNWAVVWKDTGELIGSCGLSRLSDIFASAALGYVYDKRYWGLGAATEAGRAVLDYCFERVGFHRIEAIHHTANQASGRVMIKLGMQYEGTWRQAYFDNQGAYCDVAQYSILRGDWEAQRTDKEQAQSQKAI